MKPVFHLIKRYGVSNNSPHKTLQGLPRTPFCPVLVFQPLPPEIYAHLAFRRSRPRNQRRKGAKKRVAINQGFGNQEIGRSVLWERNTNHMWQQQQQEQEQCNRINAGGENEIRSLKASGSTRTFSENVLTPKPHTHTNKSRLKQPHGILTP